MEEASLSHTVPVPMATDTTGPLQKVAVPEPTLVDVLLSDHQHSLALFDHFTLATAQGNMHVMEVLAGALAFDLRLHLQAEADCLHLALGGRLPAAVAQHDATTCQALEGDILEVLTCRREQNWKRLEAVMQKAHQDFAGHIHLVETEVLPLLMEAVSQCMHYLAAHVLLCPNQHIELKVARGELTALAGKYHRVKRSASLLPKVDAVVSEIPSEDAQGIRASLPDKIEFPETQPGP